MANEDIKILIVDDDEVNRQCGEMNLKRFTKFSNVASADDGITGLQFLEQNPDTDIVFLDRMMIHMNGVHMLQKMNENSSFRNIVPVFQTGDVGFKEKRECIENGSLYLLQKPFNYNQQGIITEFVAAKIRAKRRMFDYIESNTATETNFKFKSFSEAEQAAAHLALHYPKPLEVCEAIYELLINSIEHGNLGLGYNAKANISDYSTYINDISEKLAVSDKFVTASLEKTGKKVTLTIKDQGKGFRLQEFPEFNASVIHKHSGRGIYKARQVFCSLKYSQNGSEVVCIVE
jgi:response regulator RpfG family c-di-GMP phosphodiesterase